MLIVIVSGVKQALILTKSQSFNQMPKSVQQLIDQVSIPDQVKHIQQFH